MQARFQPPCSWVPAKPAAPLAPPGRVDEPPHQRQPYATHRAMTETKVPTDGRCVLFVC